MKGATETFASGLSTIPSTTSLESLDPGWIKRTFIIYLEPSIGAPATRGLATVRNFLGGQIGYDESHLYPLHCSLSSFFDVVCLAEDSPRVDAAFERCLKEAFLGASSTGTRNESFLLPTKMEHAFGSITSHDFNQETRFPCWEVDQFLKPPSSQSREPCAFHCHTSKSSVNVSTRVSTTASVSRRNDDGEDDVCTSDCNVHHEALGMSKVTVLEAPHVATKTTVLVSPSVLFDMETKACQGVTFDVPNREAINSGLKLVHVTSDGSIIFPVRMSWLTARQSEAQGENVNNQTLPLLPNPSTVAWELARNRSREELVPPSQVSTGVTRLPSRLDQLCLSIESVLKATVPNVRLCSRREPRDRGIRAKNARHMTLLNNKGFAVDQFENQLASIASLLDKAACTGPHPLMWDIVVNEVKRWGSFQCGGTDEDPNRPASNTLRHQSFAEPHDFVDVVRVTHVAITKH